MKLIKILILIITTLFFTVSLKALALETQEYEFSDPYISLVVEEEKVKPGDEFTFEIFYGNKGPQTAEKVLITLNQPLASRSALELVESEPEPDRWVNSEYGNLPQFLFEELEVDDPEEEEKETIKIKVRVRDSVPPQTLTPTASLQAPKRVPGKRLVVSDAIFIKIDSHFNELLDEQQVKGTATEGSQTARLEERYQEKTTPTETVYPETIPQVNQPLNLLNTEAVLTTLAFLVFVGFLCVAFFAGRKSKRK